MTFVRVISGPAGIDAQAYEIAIHFVSEWVTLANLFLVLLGFAVLANQFEQSNLPEVIPSRLPDGWLGGVALLAFVFGLSIFLDNIAGAIIGGVMARHVYRKGVTIGFQAAIVAAANAGGAGSVIGDTTTTMMWISEISPLQLVPAFIGFNCGICVLCSSGHLSAAKTIADQPWRGFGCKHRLGPRAGRFDNSYSRRCG